MRRCCFYILAVFVGWLQLAAGAERITVGEDGSVSGRFPCGTSKNQLWVFRFGLPSIPAEKTWREGEVLRKQWSTNGIRYTQTVLLSPIARLEAETSDVTCSNAVLLVNIEGENTNPEYTEATADLALAINGKPQKLELRGGLVR
ncbi:MAG TPA: hypothetical protein VEC99_16660 [Clostridia bacterium]|nr:hypothetical protein [Clostridia bacterium]